MTVKELLDKFKDCYPNDLVTFYFLKDHTLTNCQFETLIFVEKPLGWELTIQDSSELIEEVEE